MQYCSVLDSADTYSGIRFESENTNPVAYRCRSSDQRDTPVQEQGILISATTTGATIEECITFDNATEDIDDNGSGTTLTNNVDTGSAAILPTGSTPSVSGGSLFRTSNTINTTITNFVGGITDQQITVVIDDSNTTIVESSSIALTDQDPVGPSDFGVSVTLTYDGAKWNEDRRVEVV